MNSPYQRIGPPDLETVLQIVDLRDAKWFLRRHWKGLLAGLLVGLTAGYAWTYFFPVRFRSEARVRFMPPQLAGRFVNPNFSMEVEQRLFALSQLLSSRLTASRMVESFHLYPERRRFQTVADLVPLFLGDLNISQVDSLEPIQRKSVPTLRIDFRYPNAGQAQQVVQKLVEQVYEENRKYRGDQSMGTTEFLADQLRAAEEKMLDAEARYGEIQDAVRPSASQKQLGENTSRAYVVDSRLRDLRHDRRLLEERRSMKQSEVAQLEADLTVLDARPAEYYFPQVESLLNFWHLHEKMTTAKANAVRMRDRWRPGFPDRELAELDLREAERALEQFRGEQSRLLRVQDRERNSSRLLLARTEAKALDLQDASGQREEVELRAEAQRLKDQSASPAGLETDLLTAKREYESAREQHAVLARKHDESQAASDMERRGQGETVELLEPPSLPTQSESPARWARILLAALGGVAAAAFACLLRVFSDPKILHSGHVEKWAGMEVLALFPATAAERTVEKRQPPNGGKSQTWRRRAVTTTTLLLALFSIGCSERFLSAETLWKRGQSAEKDGKSAAALLFYRQAIRKDSHFAPAYRSAAHIALQHGELLAARDFLARAIEFDANDADMHVKLADTTYQIYFGDPGRPTTLLREVEALAIKIQGRWARRADGYRLQAQVLMERHRTEDAVELLRSASDKVDNSDTLDTQTAAALFRLGRGTDAELILRAVMDRAPLYLAPYDLLYLQLMQRKAPGEGRLVLDQKWSRTSDMEAALQLAAHDDAFGHRADARKILEALRDQRPRPPLVFARIGDFWMHRGDYAAARASYESGLAQFPDRATDYVSRIAEWYLAQNQTAEAKNYIARALSQRPKDLILQAYASAVTIAGADMQRRKEERRKLESILQQLPESPFVRYHLGRAYLLEGTAKAAAEQFERCVTLDPNYAPGWVALAELEISRGNPAAAEQRADAVLRVDPNHGPANLVRAKAQVSRGRTAEAKKSLIHMLELQPENGDALYLLASAEMKRNMPDQALAFVRKGHALFPAESRWFLAEAEIHAKLGQVSAARATLEAAVKTGRDDEGLVYRLATLQIQQRDGGAAIQSFQALRSRFPESLQYRLGLAGAYALTGDRRKASELYSEVENSHPQHAPAWLQHAALLAEMKDFSGARRKYEEALSRDKNNPFVLNNLAWLILQSGGPAEKALEYALQARRQFGRSQEIDDTLAVAYTRLAMFRNAAAIYEEMLTYLPEADRPRVQKLLESAKQNLSRKGEA